MLMVKRRAQVATSYESVHRIKNKIIFCLRFWKFYWIHLMLQIVNVILCIFGKKYMFLVVLQQKTIFSSFWSSCWNNRCSNCQIGSNCPNANWILIPIPSRCWRFQFLHNLAHHQRLRLLCPDDPFPYMLYRYPNGHQKLSQVMKKNDVMWLLLGMEYFHRF